MSYWVKTKPGESIEAMENQQTMNNFRPDWNLPYGVGGRCGVCLCVCDVCLCGICIYMCCVFVYVMRTGSKDKWQPEAAERGLVGRKLLPALPWENHHLSFHCRYQWQWCLSGHLCLCPLATFGQHRIPPGLRNKEDWEVILQNSPQTTMVKPKVLRSYLD